ncbi:hypothetical protein [Flavobacterium facile]|uniref:hypothetical protein n=1 Tax=Flavobacterium facile TaxID=2893174 RepID=UPI002E789B50|nr:hypothetical protein [Flavobacterium sp. T-12]
MATLVSCSTEDEQTYNQNRKNIILSTENTSNLRVTHKDSTNRVNDSISEPIKPKKD